MSTAEEMDTNPFESEQGKVSRARMEAMGFWGAAWSEAEPPPHARAAQDGDAHALIRLLSADPSLANAQDSHLPNETALHKAARGGHAACARTLAVYGASPFILNHQGLDAFAVLLDSSAPEGSLCITARVLLDAGKRARLSGSASDPMTGLSVVYQDNERPEYAARMRQVVEAFERAKMWNAARRLRATRQDCPRLCALLLRAEAPKPPVVSAALKLAVDAGHLETADIFRQWLCLHLDVIDMPQVPPSSPYPMQSIYRLCPACLAWWVVSSDASCPYCGVPKKEYTEDSHRVWWAWGKPDIPSPCFESQERMMHEALWDLAERAARIRDSRARLKRAVRSDQGRFLETRLAQATSEVQSLQSEYGYCLCSVEIAGWWNRLEVAVAGWETLSFEECGRRIEWCAALRGHWRAAVAAWERADAAGRLALGVHGEPEVMAQARQAVFACGQVQHGLLAVRVALAVRRDGRAEKGANLPACPADPSAARLRIMTDLNWRMTHLKARLDGLGLD